MQLLIDEHLSPRLVQWCAERRNPPLYAVSVAHCGLPGQPDAVVWGYALEHDFVVVTTNARDFLMLLDIEVHPGLIVLRESGLSREEQWQRLSEALDHILAQSDPESFMVNRVVEVLSPGQVISRESPTT
jgi:predicted nuclease of predicted toxin-antitoxin system